MKKLLLLCSFVLVAGMMSAQSTKKSCSKKCAKTCSKAKAQAAVEDDATKVASALSAADIAAEADESISKKVCSVSGSTSYYKESTCAKSGKISLAEVTYDEESNTFVSAAEVGAEAAPMEATATEGAAKKSCSKKCSKTCSKKKAKTE